MRYYAIIAGRHGSAHKPRMYRGDGSRLGRSLMHRTNVN